MIELFVSLILGGIKKKRSTRSVRHVQTVWLPTCDCRVCVELGLASLESQAGTCSSHACWSRVCFQAAEAIFV